MSTFISYIDSDEQLWNGQSQTCKGHWRMILSSTVTWHNGHYVINGPRSVQNIEQQTGCVSKIFLLIRPSFLIDHEVYNASPLNPETYINYFRMQIKANKVILGNKQTRKSCAGGGKRWILMKQLNTILADEYRICLIRF